VENVALTRRLPLGSVLRLTLMGHHYRMGAERAYQLGLVDELVEPGALAGAATEIAETIASNSPTAVSRSLEALWGSVELPLGEAMERGWEMVKRHRSHPDAREGPRAFMEKRPPVWEP
jgi:E-phenylitaconyl-CoA hydratase